MKKKVEVTVTTVEYRDEYKLQCVTCGGRFTRIFDAPPRDAAEAKQRQAGLHEPQCPFCSRFRPTNSA